MTISRRAFVKTAGAAAAAATVAIPAGAAVEPMAMVEGVAGLAAAPEYPFEWWVSLDGGELFSDRCNTREEAAEVARGYGGGIIAECQRAEFDLRITDNDLYDAMRAANEDAIGDGDFIEWTNEQGAELMEEVNAVIAAWVARHGINRTAWTFGCVRNQEKIVAEEEPPK
jgi:hypothetical protein